MTIFSLSRFSRPTTRSKSLRDAWILYLVSLRLFSPAQCFPGRATVAALSRVKTEYSRFFASRSSYEPAKLMDNSSGRPQACGADAELTQSLLNAQE